MNLFDNTAIKLNYFTEILLVSIKFSIKLNISNAKENLLQNYYLA